MFVCPCVSFGADVPASVSVYTFHTRMNIYPKGEGYPTALSLWYNPFVMASCLLLALHAAIRSLAAFNALPPAADAPTPPVDVTGIVTIVESPRNFVLDDGTGRARIHYVPQPLPVRTGDVIRLTGLTEYHKNRRHALIGTNCTVVGRRPVPPPARVRLSQLLAGDYDLKVVTVQATVAEATIDDLQPSLTFLTLRDGGDSLLLALANRPDAARLVGAEICVTGLFLHDNTGWRLFLDPRMHLLAPDALRIVTPPPADPFDVPALGNLVNALPKDVEQMGARRAEGRILAAWQGGHALLKTGPEWGETIRLRLAPDSPTPRIGECVEVVGKPETDLFSLTLTSARWCPLAAAPATVRPKTPDDVRDISIRDALTGTNGRFRVQAQLNGETVRIQGQVLALLETASRHPQILLESEGEQVLVDVGNRGLPSDVAPGARLSVTGILLLDTDVWRPHTIVPRIRGFFVVARTADDLVVLEQPPWWTPRRLLQALGLLACALVGILAWNRRLNRLAERRSRALLHERLAHERADLKIGERTRLAVELHDTLSQDLEGVACQVAATRNVLACAPEAAATCLDAVARMLDSCRDELRRCLFDLRGNALEAWDFAEALRRTLMPQTGQAALEIDFPVRTAAFDDAQVHAVICIVRELVCNALRHGRARHVRISGSLDDATLAFTVTDDGCGFDPAHRPGPEDGHFGIQGIRDRLRRLDGSLSVASRPGGPTEIRVALRAPTRGETA